MANPHPPGIDISDATEASELYGNLLDTADVGLVVIGTDYAICHWNQWMHNR